MELSKGIRKSSSCGHFVYTGPVFSTFFKSSPRVNNLKTPHLYFCVYKEYAYFQKRQSRIPASPHDNNRKTMVEYSAEFVLHKPMSLGGLLQQNFLLYFTTVSSKWTCQCWFTSRMFMLHVFFGFGVLLQPCYSSTSRPGTLLQHFHGNDVVFTKMCSSP